MSYLVKAYAAFGESDPMELAIAKEVDQVCRDNEFDSSTDEVGGVVFFNYFNSIEEAVVAAVCIPQATMWVQVS